VAGSSPAARTILWVQRLEGWLSGYRHLTRNYILFRHRYAEKPVFTGSNPLSPPPVASSYFPLCLAVAGPFWGTLRGYGWGYGGVCGAGVRFVDTPVLVERFGDKPPVARPLAQFAGALVVARSVPAVIRDPLA